MATKAKKPKEKYKPNTFVVHPHHGAAKVIRKVNKNVEIFVEGEPKSKRIPVSYTHLTLPTTCCV